MTANIKNSRPKLIVGLGNPGDEYRYTRHNVGAWFVHSLGQRFGGEFKRDKKFHGELAEIFIDGHKLRLLFPTTYMNLSGQAIRAVTDYFDIAPEEVLVAYDDLDLDVADIRLKFSGGHGGHNGLRDTHQHIGKDYWRLRIGVGHPGDKKKVSNYLTKNKPSRKEEELLLTGIKKVVDDMKVLLSDGYEKTMAKWHTKVTSKTPSSKIASSKPSFSKQASSSQLAKAQKEKVNTQSNDETKPIKTVNLIKRSSREGQQLNAKTALAVAFEKAKKEEE